MNKLWCFFGVHEMQVILKGYIVDDRGKSVGQYYNLQCTLCGKLKKKKLL